MNKRQLALFLIAGFFAGGSESYAANGVAPADIQIFCAPVLQPNEPTELFVSGSSGASVDGLSLKVNDTVVKTDAKGYARFIVPDCKELTISAPRIGGAAKTFFYKRVEALLARQNLAGNLIANLHKATPSSNRKIPRIFLAPLVVEPNSEFVLGGANFSNAPQECTVRVDGKEALILASSPVCLVVKAPGKLSPSPIRDITVTSANVNSNTVETDICNLTASWPAEADKDGAPQRARLVASGTNMPCLVKMVNQSPDGVSFWLPDQKPMGKQGLFLTPGGAENHVDFQIKRKDKQEPQVTTELIEEVPVDNQGDQSGIANTVSMQTRKELCLSRMIRLNRRLIGVQSKLEETKREMERDGSQSESLLVQIQYLSLRQNRIQEALQARRELFQLLGGTEELYRSAVNKSVGGAPLEVELAIVPGANRSGAAVALPANEVSGVDSSQPKRRPRLHRFIEPQIKLLPPLPEGETADPKSSLPTPSGRGNADSVNNASAASEATASGQLRPSLPESPVSSPAATKSVVNEDYSSAPAAKASGTSKPSAAPAPAKKAAKAAAPVKQVVEPKKKNGKSTKTITKRKKPASPSASQPSRQRRRRR